MCLSLLKHTLTTILAHDMLDPNSHTLITTDTCCCKMEHMWVPLLLFLMLLPLSSSISHIIFYLLTHRSTDLPQCEVPNCQNNRD